MKISNAAALGTILCLIAGGCGSEDPFDPTGPYDGGGTTWECYGANDCQPGQYCNEFHYCVDPPVQDGGLDGDVDGDAGDAAPWIPPEIENELSSPASGSRSVYIALSHLDTVARVDSETLDITSIPVGDSPVRLATVPDEDVAIVLNRGDFSVSIVRSPAGEEDRVVTLRTPPWLNRLVVAPDGQVALAYFELEDPSAQDVGSFQDLAVIVLEEGREEVITGSVGFRPKQISFTEDGSVAHVMTEDGVSIIDLGGVSEGFVAPTVPVSADPLSEGDPDEVIVAPDGSFAFARWGALALVRAVDLSTGELQDLELSGVPTDIDLNADGTRMIAAVREPASQLVVIEVPAGFSDPSAVTSIDCAPLIVGSVVLSPEGDQLLGFTNALNQKAVLIVDLETGAVQAVLLRKGVRAVSLSPDGRFALIIHNRLPGEPEPTDDFETQLDRRPGFSVLDVESLFVKLQLTGADPGAFTFVPDSSAIYLIVADRETSLREIDRIDLGSFLVTPSLVSSHPVEIGHVPETSRIYVSQDHPMGRLSFIDVESDEVRTVTGFELNGQITE